MNELETKPSQHHKLLVVDDEAIIRSRLKELGEKLNLIVKTASDGSEGWVAYKQFQPDLVVLDIYMPVMNGLVLMWKIKEINPDCPVILISAYLNCEELSRSTQLKPEGFVPKPFKLEDIGEMISRLLESKEYQSCAQF